MNTAVNAGEHRGDHRCERRGEHRGEGNIHLLGSSAAHCCGRCIRTDTAVAAFVWDLWLGNLDLAFSVKNSTFRIKMALLGLKNGIFSAKKALLRSKKVFSVQKRHL